MRFGGVFWSEVMAARRGGAREARGEGPRGHTGGSAMGPGPAAAGSRHQLAGAGAEEAAARAAVVGVALRAGAARCVCAHMSICVSPPQRRACRSYGVEDEALLLRSGVLDSALAVVRAAAAGDLRGGTMYTDAMALLQVRAWQYAFRHARLMRRMDIRMRAAVRVAAAAGAA